MSLPVKIFATTGSKELAEDIYNILKKKKIPIYLGKSQVIEFDNENLEVKVDNVRGHFVVVIDTHVSPVNTRLMELLALLDAIKNASAADVLLVFGYMDCSRSDRKDKPRISTMGKLLAKCITELCGVRKVILLDPHSGYNKEYFEPTADEISVRYLWIDYIKREFFVSRPKKDHVIVFSDLGSAKRYEEIPELLGLPYAYIDKGKRDEQDRPKIKGIVGRVKNKHCFLIDDEVLGGGTLIEATKALLKKGALSVSALLVHGILTKKGMVSTEVVRRLEASPIEKIVLTNSVPLGNKLAGTTKFHVISVEGLLAEAIRRTVLNKSLTELYQLDKVAFYRS